MTARPFTESDMTQWNLVQVNGGWVIEWNEWGHFSYEGIDGYIARDPRNAQPFGSKKEAGNSPSLF